MQRNNEGFEMGKKYGNGFQLALTKTKTPKAQGLWYSRAIRNLHDDD